MAIPARIERATYSLGNCCSIQLSYGIVLEIQAKLHDFMAHEKPRIGTIESTDLS